ncbi:MAG: potassium transporter TrkG [Lentisphaeria bacterium]
MRLIPYRFTSANRFIFLRNMFIRHSLLLVMGFSFHIFMLMPILGDSTLFGAKGIVPIDYDLFMFWGLFFTVSCYFVHWFLRFAQLKFRGKVDAKVGQVDLLYFGVLPIALYLVSFPLHLIGSLVGLVVGILQGYYLSNSDMEDFLRSEGRRSYRKLGLFRQRKRVETEVLPFCLLLILSMVVMEMQYAFGLFTTTDPRYWLALGFGLLSTLYCLWIWTGIIRNIWTQQKKNMDAEIYSSGQKIRKFLSALSWSFWVEIILLCVFLGLIGQWRLTVFWLPMMLLMQIVLFYYIWQEGETSKSFWNWLMEHPIQMLVCSFAVLIVAGATVLSLPICGANNSSIGVLNAFFTSTSAVCVTGLIVVDTATAFSSFGKWVIIILIQLGALGIMSLSGFMALLMGRRFSLRGDAALRQMTGEEKSLEVRSLLKTIIFCTFLIECVGGTLLTLYFMCRHNMSFPLAFVYGFFHSISAFCNAGFALYSDNLMSFAREPFVLIVISFLIIFGGMGFGVFQGVLKRLCIRKKLKLGFQEKIVLWMTAGLCVGGTMLIFILEYHHSLAHFGIGNGICNAWFQAVASRTAGFNSIDLCQMTHAGLLVMMVLMFIGAAPGSTGGGVKVTTMAVLLMLVRSWINGDQEVMCDGRQIPQRTVRQATAVFLLSGIVAILGTFLLSISMPSTGMLPIVYEVLSALGTVGFSVGVTNEITSFGKIVIMLIMFLGRVGPLTFLVALSSTHREKLVKYPVVRVHIG